MHFLSLQQLQKEMSLDSICVSISCLNQYIYMHVLCSKHNILCIVPIGIPLASFGLVCQCTAKSCSVFSGLIET